ncbi:DUF5677 domain-containing protein [Photobacterium alginatilyticum]
MEDYFNRWAAVCSHFIGDHLDRCKPFLDMDYKGLDPLVRFVSTQLYLSCHFSSQSSLLLIKEGQSWDADIINRSVIEGVVKYIYMLHCSEEESLSRVKEFWEILPKNSAVKRSSRANSFLNASGYKDNNEWKAIQDLVLTDEEVDYKRAGTNKKERHALEQKWSFSNIVNEFSKDGDKGLGALVHLSYNYGMSSHLIHKDGDGVGMIWERMTREPERYEVATLAHSARVISDLCTFSEIRSLVLFNCCKADDSFISPLRKSYEPFFQELNEIQQKFNEIEYGN